LGPEGPGFKSRRPDCPEHNRFSRRLRTHTGVALASSPSHSDAPRAAAQVRAYFAPVERTTGGVTVFDPAKYGGVQLDDPPAPWLDLGWIDSFQRRCGTTTESLRAGLRGVTVSQFRGALEARVEFDFRTWGKLQMALASGSEHMNVLAADPSANAQPSGGSALAAVAVLPDSTASEIVLGTGAVDAFDRGDLLAVDMDYAQQTGYVGSGIAAAYVRDPVDVLRDVNYVRRVTFNVGRVAEKTATSVLLAQPLLGGAPAAGAGAQKVVAFVDREGGSFFQEWSALFVAEEESGGRVCFYYPRLSPSTKPDFVREQSIEIAGEIVSLGLHAAFVAMPHADENDGRTVVCYRSYFPARAAGV